MATVQRLAANRIKRNEEKLTKNNKSFLSFSSLVLFIHSILNMFHQLECCGVLRVNMIRFEFW